MTTRAMPVVCVVGGEGAVVVVGGAVGGVGEVGRGSVPLPNLGYSG